MIFTNLKMIGFKSFAEGEQITIAEGLTGIVGPNGCGKSNIVESLRWLMGESSAKSMRGGELEDIIFAGTSSRPSRNFAEVTLRLDNSARTAPAAFNDGDEIEITRRIDRNKGTSFKINSKTCRARDVQLLFADMATGARSSGLVSQGKVGTLINAKPTERRHLLEEAANIRGLHQRRHEAELRLNTAEVNLGRLDDILIQLGEQKDGLIKQARQAVRYRSIAERIRKADAHLQLARFTRATDRLSETEGQLREAEGLVADAVKDVSAQTRHHDSMAETLPPLRQREAEIAAELQSLTITRNALDQEQEQIKQAQQALVARRQQIETDFAREEQLLSDAERAIESLNDEREQITADNNDDDPKYEAAAKALTEARKAAEIAEQNLAEATARRATTEQQTKARRQHLEESQTRLELTRTALNQLNLEEAATRAKTAAAERRKAEDNVASLEKERKTLDASLEAAQSKARIALDNQAQTLQKFTEIKAQTETLSALLTPKKGQSKSPVSASITVSGGLEAGLAAVLGETLTAPIGKHENSFWQDRKSQNIAPPHGMTPLTDYLKIPPALEAAVSGIGVAKDAQIAAKAQPNLTAGQAITTPQGGLWRWDGFVEPIGAETPSAVRLKQEARLRELTAALEAEQKTLTKADKAADEATKALAEQEAASQNLRRREHQAGQDLMDRARADGVEKSAHLAAQERHDDLTKNLAQLEAAVAEAQADSAQDINPEPLDLEGLTHEAQSHRQNLAEAMSREQVIRSAREARDHRLKGINQEMEVWAERQKGAHSRLDELKGRRTEAEQEAKRLAERPDDITARRHQLGDAIDACEKKRIEAADALTQAETNLNTAQSAQRKAEQNLAQHREDSIRIEATRDLAQQEQNTIIARIKENLNVAPDALRELAELKPDSAVDTDDEALNTLELRYERLVRERENFGPVNLVAETELEKLEEQVAGIQSEYDDLTAGIAKLRGAINQLNREGRERLLKSFTEVNKYFTALFKTLFDGGSAELKLTEGEDPLEAGLEILASPPGKKLQTLSLLSGGEQALAALALIFAVFLTNPSPICVLDEVDAPLDDTNVGRFCDMLAQIAHETETRFIVVTHHRLTMARMDRLYGVTMEQQGVSRIVSVDLQTAEHYKEIA